jgi:biopolymer transport protein ExbD
MQFAWLGRAGWVSFLLIGCVWCAGCKVEHPARAHLLSIDFRPDNPKLIDVRLDDELLVTDHQGGEVPNWDPLVRRISELAKKADAGGSKEVKLRAGERVPYETVGSALLCGVMGGYMCEVRGGKDVELVLWRPASEEKRFYRILHRLSYSEYILECNGVQDGERNSKPAIRVDLLGDGTAEVIAAGRYTIRVGKATPTLGELQATLEDLRQKDAAGELPPVLIAPDFAIWHKDVMAACRAARGAGFKEIYFIIPK